MVRAGQGLATLHARLQQLMQVMSFTASSIAAALSDRVPDGQLGPDAWRHLKSSLGMDLHPSFLFLSSRRPAAFWSEAVPTLPVATLNVFWDNGPQNLPFALVCCLGTGPAL